MRISDWSSDVCSSDLLARTLHRRAWQVAGGHVVAVQRAIAHQRVESGAHALGGLQHRLVVGALHGEHAANVGGAEFGAQVGVRSDKRRVGKEVVRKWTSGW